ncbi:MAG: hypothetical protein MJ252_15700 [archaeon]|nr:hypothetical protein [archaeon]
MEKKRLSTKFTRCFCYPILIGTILSLALSIVFFIQFFSKMKKNEEIKEIFDEIKEEKAYPLLINVILFLNSSVQKYFDNLVKFREMFRSLKENLLDVPLSGATKEEQIYFYLKNGFNSAELTYAQGEFSFCGGDFSCIYNLGTFRAIWSISPDITTLDGLDKEQEQLYKFVNLIPLLKASYDTSDTNEKFLFFFNSTELYLEYPFDGSNADYFNVDRLKQYDHDFLCENNKHLFPDYFYFKCTKFYYAIEKAAPNNYAILDSFEMESSTGESFEASAVCIKFNEEEGGTEPENNIIICQIIDMEKMKAQFESYNNLFKGYFFIMKMGSKYPFYYPNKNVRQKYDSIESLEFGINDDYYLTEISEYLTKIPEMITPSMELIQRTAGFNISKKGETYKYTLFPGTQSFAEDYKAGSILAFSIVSVSKLGEELDLIEHELHTKILLALLFISMGIFLSLLSNNSLSSLAQKIVKPIKIIKQELETSFEGQEDDSDEGKEENQEGAKNQSNALVVNGGKKADGANNQTEEENDNDSDDDSDEDEEDDSTENRSSNLQKLFELLVDLKNTIIKLRKPATLTAADLPFLSHAQKIFQDIDNETAVHSCHSNISTLFINSQQYDKAISHLVQSIKNFDGSFIETKDWEKDETLKENKEKIKNDYKSENVTKRFTKLFYCYKQYFKFLKKEKSRYLDLKSNYLPQKIDEYRKRVNRFYILTTQITKETKDISLANLEKIEEILMFEFPNKFFPNQNKSDEEKREMIREVLEYFKRIQENNTKLLTGNYNVLHLIKVLKFEWEIVDSIDIPPSIFHQHLNFLQGKFYYQCQHYFLAISHFEKSLEANEQGNEVGNITKRIKAMKYLYKIGDLCKKVVDLEDTTFRIIEGKKSPVEGPNKKKQLAEYLAKTKREIDKFKYLNKDVSFIINLSDDASDDIIGKMLDLIKNTFKNLITYRDRISFIIYHKQNFEIQIKLTQKTEENEKNLLNVIESMDLKTMTNDVLLEGPDNDEKRTLLAKDKLIDEDLGESDMYKCFCFASSYFNKKQKGENMADRINWHVYLCKKVERKDFNAMRNKDLNKVTNLIVVHFDSVNSEDQSTIKYTFDDKDNNYCLNYEEEFKIKDIMATNGEEQLNTFEMEKFKNKIENA